MSTLISTLKSLPSVSKAVRIGDRIEVTTTVAATSALGSTDRIFAQLVRAAFRHGLLSRAVAACEVSFTRKGAGVWQIAA